LIINFISDTHADHLLMSGTSPANRLELRRLRHWATIECLKNASPDSVKIHAGDLFHGKNPKDSEGLGFALQQASACDWVLAGNHDVTNTHREDSAFEVMKQVKELAPKLITTRYGDTEHIEIPGLGLVCLPHVADQALFETKIKELCIEYAGKDKTLLLHCNIRMAEHMEDETSLNLTEELMKCVSDTFKVTFVGHNHQHRTFNGGKIVSIGTPFPLSFSDVGGAKGFGYVSYDTDTGEVTHVPMLKKEQCFMEVDIADFANEASFVMMTNALPQLVRIAGERQTGADLVKIAKTCYGKGALAISWKLESDLMLTPHADRKEVREEDSFDVVERVKTHLSEAHNETLGRYLDRG